jgi:uncharacterized protein
MEPIMPIRIQVSDLLSTPGKARSESVSAPLHIHLPGATVDSDAAVELALRSLSDGIVVRGVATVTAELTCDLCLTEWSQEVSVPLEQVYRLQPDDEDDELPLDEHAWVDIEPVVHDEVSLGLPRSPRCRSECRGLCPTCGSDLNVDPCGGHGEDVASPFAALRDLLES